MNKLKSKNQPPQRKYDNYESSSEEEDSPIDTIIAQTLKNHGSNNALGNTQSYLEDVLTSGALVCLICISSVKRSDPTWPCEHCYALFHLTCIQRWSKDTLTHKKAAQASRVQVRHVELVWDCPKCRHHYAPDAVPLVYHCFCTKTINPAYEPLLVPHSCGEPCNKPLRPDCGHQCRLLCHPGPCPPCSQTLPTTCYCGASKPTVHRCSQREWSCGNKCSRTLTCAIHTCVATCHAGACQPCAKKSVQPCRCKAARKLRDCSEPHWTCDKICGKPLACGSHKCSEVCHSADASHACKLAETRTCPCGRSSHKLPCTEEIPTCGQTCGKLLQCGNHQCAERCHYGDCGQCKEIISKTCRCGRYTSDVPCYKPFLCENKCKELRDCGKHPCNRKCCDGNCAICEKPCGRTLQCANHKCGSICHRGPCYPCQTTTKRHCRCGQTHIVIPCGRRHRRSQVPKCPKVCKHPSTCHHKVPTRHLCHYGDCPPCKQMCGKSRLQCSHTCPASCHSAVVIAKLSAIKASMPWEETSPVVQVESLPCPACVVPVMVTCLGEHESINWPCHRSTPSSCHRPCGRPLACGNHTCTKACHDPISEECDTCDAACSQLRPLGCTHLCGRPCHPGSCQPCNQMLRTRCHCGLNQPYVRCADFNEQASTAAAIPAVSCDNQCPNNYDCGHRCRSNCHAGPCLPDGDCKRKVKSYCLCKRIRKDVLCHLVREGSVSIPCDDECEQQRQAVEQKRLEDECAKQLLDIKRNEEELRKYEQRYANGGSRKRHRDRRTKQIDTDDRSLFGKYWMAGVGALLGFVVTALYLTFEIDN